MVFILKVWGAVFYFCQTTLHRWILIHESRFACDSADKKGASAAKG